MYVDNLTLMGLVIFLVAILLVFKFCICKLCGGPNLPDCTKDDEG